MNDQRTFSNKYKERFAYLFLLCSLFAGRITVTLLARFSFMIPKLGKQKDFLFFPYAHKDNSGTVCRFQIYLPFLERDGYSYDIDYICDEKYYNKVFGKNKSRVEEYFFYHHIFWSRLFRIITAKKYKAVFFHRVLFPDYYNHDFPDLSKLLRKFNNNITVDYFDANHVQNRALIHSTISFCDKVCVVNEHLYKYYSQIHKRVYYNNLAVDISPYFQKQEYELHNPIRIFWTGNPQNASNLKDILPILEKINTRKPLKLVMICKTNAGYSSPVIEHHKWDEKPFFKYLSESDIAIYPALIDDEHHRGKVAFKVLDYVASRVPVIASPLGLSQNFEDNKDVLVANNEEEWEKNILRLIDDKQLRVNLANNAYQKLLQYHSVEATYQNFLKILAG